MSEYSTALSPEVVLLLPAYNEEQRSAIAPPGFGLEAAIEKYSKALEANFDSFQVRVVDDGSTDNTAKLAEKCGADVLSLPHQGRGGALKQGFLRTPGQLAAAYTDADGSYSADTIISLFDRILNGADIAVAYREEDIAHGSVDWKSEFLRKLGHQGMHRICERVAPTGANDPQAGAKAFRADTVPLLWDAVKTPGWAADREVLHLASLMDMKVENVGAAITTVGNSTVKLLPDAFRMVRDSVRLRYRHRDVKKTDYSPQALDLQLISE